MHTSSFNRPAFTVLFCLLLVCLLGAPPCSAQAQTSAPTDALLLRGKAVLHHGTNQGATDSLRYARALFKQATGGFRLALAHYYAGLADYRIVTQLPDDAEDRREQVLTDAIDHLKHATEADPKMADAWALLSACYGQMMGIHPMKGMSLGPKADKALEKAQVSAPQNPRVWIISGTQDYFTPGVFGGEKERALEKFEKAVWLAEQETVEDPLMPDWGHTEAHAWIGIAHMNAKRCDQARTAFETALDISPDYGWIQSVLLPKLNEQQS
jgi:tetratricopeptide (TPR) repeat protein